MNPTTVRAHYITLDETATADEVLSAIAGVVRPPGPVREDEVAQVGLKGSATAPVQGGAPA